MCFNEELVTDIEEIRHKLSALLMDTDEAHPLQCYIAIGEEEAMGLSSLQIPHVISMFQQPSEGIIWFNLEGVEEPIEFDDMFESDLITIANSFGV